MANTPVKQNETANGSHLKRSQSLKSPSPKKDASAKSTMFDLWSSYEIERGVRANNRCKNVGGQLIGKPEDEKVETCWDGFLHGLEASRHANCLGWRHENEFKWWTYQEVYDKIRALAAALAAQHKLKRQDRIGIYAGSKPNWAVVALAASSRSLTFVPLYDTLGADSCTFIINQVEMPILFIDTPVAAKRIISNSRSTPSLKTVVLFQEPETDLVKLAIEHHINLVSLDQFTELYRDVPAEEAFDPPTAEDIYVIMYTSGTTGDPKGVIHTQRAVVADFIGIDHIFLNDFGQGLKFTKNDVGLQYLPMAHSYGMLVLNWFLYTGASIGFFGGNILKLTEDAEILKPTFLPLVPRLMNRIYTKIVAEINKGGIKSKLFWYAYRRKLENMKQGYITRDSIWDKIVFKKIQNLLGGRVWFMSVGSAPVSAEVLEFWRVCFGALILEGYGQTECAACATVAMGPFGGNVGHPLQSNYIRLVDVPECGYFVADGKGEICIKGINVMKGYFKRPDLTAEALDNDGWLHTGDIGEFLKDGSLKIVDRKKNIFKLAQGEYIAPEKIENVYALCPEILQVFVDGSTLESYTVAVVVPEPTHAAEYAKRYNVDPKQLHLDLDYRKYLLEALTIIGKENKLNSLEQVKTLYIAPELFSIENGLLTPTMKNKRPDLRKFFKDQIADLYKAGPLLGADK